MNSYLTEVECENPACSNKFKADTRKADHLIQRYCCAACRISVNNIRRKDPEYGNGKRGVSQKFTRPESGVKQASRAIGAIIEAWNRVDVRGKISRDSRILRNSARRNVQPNRVGRSSLQETS